nr:isoform b of f-box/wd repeat-containing protein sel-10 [Quercus suber]
MRPAHITTPTPSMTSVPTMPIPVPTHHPNVIPGNTLPSAPASPPTPAPSPTPMQNAPDWSTADPNEDMGDMDLDNTQQTMTDHASTTSSTRGYGFGYRHMRAMFADMENDERQRMLGELLNMCDGKLLGFVANFVGPRLKRDPFSVLPNELCLRILTFIDDAKTLARSSQVSKRWRELVSDDMAWKSLCEKHAYRRLSDDERPSSSGPRSTSGPGGSNHEQKSQHPYGYSGYAQNPALAGLSSSAPDLTRSSSLNTVGNVLPPTLSARGMSSTSSRGRPKTISYRSHFKQRYQVETAWRTGGKVDTRQITPDQGVVTSLHLTPDYIIVALDNAKIHVFDTEGRHLRCLQGHVMGVWAMVPCGHTLVSGGCDRDVRVWDLKTGMPVHMLRGHTSTVRCLKMSGPNIAISGSRDTTLRVWDIKKGVCRHVLVGHQASVRCLEICGDLVVSGSYDTTARIWSISEGRCLRTLQGHFSQIYAVAFDGHRVATGSLDTSVRIWDPRDGRCLAQLQGHTSLVGQLQLRNDTLVTGGSDGSVRVWSLQTYSAIHRLAAHDNSVTSLQFDDGRIVSGGSDGRVKVWDLQHGHLVRELGTPAEAVWRVVFEEEKAVVLASRAGKTVMEVWSFAPPPDSDDLLSQTPSASSSTTIMFPRSASSSHMSIPAITPYQDPEFGEKPSYTTDASALERVRMIHLENAGSSTRSTVEPQSQSQQPRPEVAMHDQDISPNRAHQAAALADLYHDIWRASASATADERGNEMTDEPFPPMGE